MENHKPRVCIIGAGPTGLVALRHLSEVADCTCYEMKDQIGGLWVNTGATDRTVDEKDLFYAQYGHAHESIYENLTTIIPMHFFSFKDFHPKIEHLHFTQNEVLAYLKAYA
jgi:cation diffusion facilitator CzcD-associated flavoprotein CzcO